MPATPRSRLADLPGPRPLSLLGNLHQLHRARLHQDMEHWAREYGPLFRVAEELSGIDGLFEGEGSDWHNQRRTVMQAFAPHAIKAYFPSLVRVAGRLQRRWLRQSLPSPSNRPSM
ncbi:MAG: hypothetical protein EOO78_25830, partial [Oxalobacteraceae bacterium]